MDIEGIRPPARGKTNHPQNRPKLAPLRPDFFRAGQPPVRPRVAIKQADVSSGIAAPRYYKPAQPAKQTRRTHIKKAILLRSAAAMAVLVLGTGGFFSWKAYSNLHKVFRGTTTVAALASKPVTPDLLKGEGDGRVNILLLGVGGPGHDGADLTDTMVLMSVDPLNNTAAMVSIPRDLWVKQPVNYFGSVAKINAAYESGKYRYLNRVDASQANANAVEAGFTSVDQVIKNVLDVNVNYHVLVNFQAFRQAIDTVGGVDVNVPEQLYDPTMSWENHNSPILATAGPQQMNGVKALLYARSRETTSDFARSQRQRQILLALKDKVLTAGTLSNPAKIEGLMNAFGNNVFSDLSTQGATRLYSIMQKVSDSKVASVGLTDEGHKLVTTDRVGNSSVVRPVAGFDNYAPIQAYVHSQIPDGYLVKENAPVTLLAQNAIVANAKGALLKNYGYNVTATVVASQPLASPVVVDLSEGNNPFTKHYLEVRYGVKAVTNLPAGVSVPAGTAKFVILDTK